MENAAEALKIAFAIAMFIMALTLSISSFSQANNAVNTIVAEKDRDVGMEIATMDLGYEQYVYVEPASNLTRKVGIETVISSLYRVPEQNLEVHFCKDDGGGKLIPIDIYRLVNADGEIVVPERCTNYIDLAHPNLNFENPKQFLDVLIGGSKATYSNEVKNKYIDRLVYSEGLYEKFKDTEFEERLGEYVQGENASEITKRVITYVIK